MAIPLHFSHKKLQHSNAPETQSSWESLRSSHCCQLPSCLTQDLNLMQFKLIQSHEGVLHSQKKEVFSKEFLLFALDMTFNPFNGNGSDSEKGWNGRLFYFLLTFPRKNNKTINMKLKNHHWRFSYFYLMHIHLTPFCKKYFKLGLSHRLTMVKLVHKNNISTFNEILISFFINYKKILERDYKKE